MGHFEIYACLLSIIFRRLYYSHRSFLDQGNEATLFSFNATTVDGVFSIRWNMCSAQYTYPNTNGVMVTPNNTKIDVQIANFPYAFEFSSFAFVRSLFKYHFFLAVSLKPRWPMHRTFQSICPSICF